MISKSTGLSCPNCPAEAHSGQMGSKPSVHCFSASWPRTRPTVLYQLLVLLLLVTKMAVDYMWTGLPLLNNIKGLYFLCRRGFGYIWLHSYLFLSLRTVSSLYLWVKPIGANATVTITPILFANPKLVYLLFPGLPQ